MTGGNQVPFCLPPPTLPPLCHPLPQSRCSVKISLTEGAFPCHCDAAWDGVNGGAFANEKLCWRVLEDKAPTLGPVSVLLFTMLLPEMVFDQEMAHRWLHVVCSCFKTACMSLTLVIVYLNPPPPEAGNVSFSSFYYQLGLSTCQRQIKVRF